MSPSIQREVLETVRVVGDIHAVECGIASELFVSFGIVVDVVLAKSWDVVKTVNEIRCPEDETVALTDVPALCADLREWAASEEAGWADDGLLGCVLAAVVATPCW